MLGLFEFVQENPHITTDSLKFRNLMLSDHHCLELAYLIIDSYPFIGQTASVYNSKGFSSTTLPVTASQVGSIKKYLKAFIDVDRSPLEIYFPGFNAAEAKHKMVLEIIDKRQDLYHLYVEYKRDVVERTRARTTLPSPSPRTPQVQITRVTSLPHKVRVRDGGACRVTGVASLGDWEDRPDEASEKYVGYGEFMRCEVAHAIPWGVDKQYWELIRRLFGVSGLPTSADIAENALLLQAPIHDNFQDYKLYFDPGFVLRCREVGNIRLKNIMRIIHVRNGSPAFDGQYLNLPILPCPTNLSTPSVPDINYIYFLLHKLIGDIVFYMGGAETLGLDEFDLDEDPWTETHLVSELSLPVLQDKLYRIQESQQPSVGAVH